MSLNTGLKYTHTFMDDNSCYEDLSADQQWSISPAYGYALKYKENIMGVYASFSTEINRWAFIAGLRGEYTRTANESDRIKRDYFDPVSYTHLDVYKRQLHLYVLLLIHFVATLRDRQS